MGGEQNASALSNIILRSRHAIFLNKKQKNLIETEFFESEKNEKSLDFAKTKKRMRAPPWWE